MQRRLFPALGALILLSATQACQRIPESHPPGYRDFATPFVPPVPAPPPQGVAQLRANPRAAELNQSIDVVIEGTRGFAEPLPEAPPGFQAEMERFFVAVGRLADLLDLYAARVRADGPGSPFAPRLAVLLTEVGYRAEARTLLDDATQATPGDPFVEAALAIWILGTPNPDEQVRIEGARHLLSVGAGADFDGIFVYGPQWPQRTLDSLSHTERHAAAGDLAPIAQRHVAAAVGAAAEAD